MLAFIFSKPIPIQWSHWILYCSKKLFLLSSILAAIDASVPSNQFILKNFVMIWLKLASNTRTVTRYNSCKPMSLLPWNIIPKGDWVILSFSSSKKLSLMQLATTAVFVLPQVKFLPTQLSNNSFLIKGAKWSIIVKNICCTTSITDLTAVVIIGSYDIDPTFCFLAYKHIHLQYRGKTKYLGIKLT